jgi:SAM-dependent methyltransferase
MATSILKNQLSSNTRQKLRKLQRRLLRLRESFVGGGKRRESVLLKSLGSYYARQYRRDWQLGEEEPHFFSQRMGFFDFAFGQRGHGAYSFYRGFFASEVLHYNDRLLDIGCGDGFFTRRFFGERCAHIDAVDIEPSAIEAANMDNGAPNITYHLLDAVNQPFPGDKYDVIVWDGAIGHFAASTTNLMLEKISKALKPEGVFVGSESLGMEGSDHLQFFDSLDDLYKLFKSHFGHIELRSEGYHTGFGLDGFFRVEGYWRCANDPTRLKESGWRVYSPSEAHEQPLS